MIRCLLALATTILLVAGCRKTKPPQNSSPASQSAPQISQTPTPAASPPASADEMRPPPLTGETEQKVIIERKRSRPRASVSGGNARLPDQRPARIEKRSDTKPAQRNGRQMQPADPFALFEEIVYSHATFSSEEPTASYQIYKMRADGSHQISLTSKQDYAWSPDVNYRTKQIVFFSVRCNGLCTMDINGDNVTAIPNTLHAGWPKWSRGADPFIIFVQYVHGNSSAIFRIRPDGSGMAQLTNPAENESDEIADVVDDNFIVFTRLENGLPYDRNLYLKYIGDNRPAVPLTNTADQTETIPVVSHDGRKIAYRVSVGTANEEIHVASLDTNTSSINVLHIIHLSIPTIYNISGIDFSADNTRLYFSVEDDDIPDSLINNRQEIFSTRLDGSDQHRLTFNAEQDVYPSVVPR